MGCSESKNSVATGNTMTQSKKPGAADDLKKIENKEKVPDQQEEAKVAADENKGSGGTTALIGDVKEVASVVEVETKDVDEVDEKEKSEKTEENASAEKPVEEKEAEKENGANEVAANGEGSMKEAEPTPTVPATPAVAEKEESVVAEAVNPAEKKE